MAELKSGGLCVVGKTAQGNYSLAAGYRAKSLVDGTFCWGDTTNADLNCSAPHSFVTRSSGGVSFYTSSGLSTGVTAAPGSGSWSSVSDRNVKENFTTLNAIEILQRVAQLPLSTWNYKTQDQAIRHIGPMAQDFYAAFGVGEDNKHISTIDADGVSLAAIQGLYQIVQDKDQRISQLENEVTQLKNGAAPDQSFNPFNAISLIALGGVVMIGLKLRRGPAR